MALLGVGKALKEDLYCTAAKLVHGVTLHLPAEFFDNSSSDDSNLVSDVGRLKATTHAAVASNTTTLSRPA